MTVIRNGTVLSSGGWITKDVAIAEDGSIAALGSNLSDERVIDATGCLVGPGFVDLHTHLREPGQTWKEDIASGSRAAAAGGYTAVVAMPNTDPPMDSPKVIDLVAKTGRRVGLVDVVPSAALTKGRAGSTAVDIVALYESGVRIFTDDGDSVSSDETLEEIMRIVADLPGAVIAQHAEDSSLTAGGQMHDGTVARSLGIGGLPYEAEVGVIRRDLDLVRLTGARYHCQHVSAKTTVEMVRSAKAEGLPVSAEVTPHHLSFTHEDLRSLDPNFKMYPPLRTEEDRTALIAGLRDGTIDTVATDHAPHQTDEKEVDFTSAPRGVIGLETAASVTWEAVGDPDILFRVLSSNPASIADIHSHGGALEPGSPANIVVFDPSTTWAVTEFHSKSANSPYLGGVLLGRVKATIFGGRITYRDGGK